MNRHDDWVYIGKETYGTRHWNRADIKPGTKFFDVLGKAYDKMKAKIKYYIFKDAIDRKEYETAMEFEVYGRLIKDSEGNDIQAFIKEDKRNGLRMDSSFYWDGNWEVIETDEAARIIRSKTSLGVKIVSSHDNRWRVTSRVMTDKNNDTLALEQYVWKNGRLAKTVLNGVERIFVYGKTLMDTVRVIPSDEGIGFHRGYNNSIRAIPGENDPVYRYFAMDPYGGYEIPPDNNSFLKKEMPMLFKENYVDEFKYSIDYPIPLYYNPPFTNNLSKKRIYPKDSANGESNFSLYLNSKCKDDGCGKFYIDGMPQIGNESITLYASFFVYEQQEWRRYCRTEGQINATHLHEIKHLNNAKNMVKLLGRSYIPTLSYSTKEECEAGILQANDIIKTNWSVWKIKEEYHLNPESPQPTPFILEKICKLEL